MSAGEKAIAYLARLAEAENERCRLEVELHAAKRDVQAFKAVLKPVPAGKADRLKYATGQYKAAEDAVERIISEVRDAGPLFASSAPPVEAPAPIAEPTAPKKAARCPACGGKPRGVKSPGGGWVTCPECHPPAPAIGGVEETAEGTVTTTVEVEECGEPAGLDRDPAWSAELHPPRNGQSPASPAAPSSAAWRLTNLRGQFPGDLCTDLEREGFGTFGLLADLVARGGLIAYTKLFRNAGPILGSLRQWYERNVSEQLPDWLKPLAPPLLPSVLDQMRERDARAKSQAPPAKVPAPEKPYAFDVVVKLRDCTEVTRTYVARDEKDARRRANLGPNVIDVISATGMTKEVYHRCHGQKRQTLR